MSDIVQEMGVELAKHHAASLDSEISVCIDTLLGPGWFIGDLKGRLQRVNQRGVPYETYSLDGIAFLRVWPPHTEVGHDGESIKFNVTQKYERLVP